MYSSLYIELHLQLLFLAACMGVHRYILPRAVFRCRVLFLHR